ncbi:MAG: porin [Halioglobus sp.]
MSRRSSLAALLLLLTYLSIGLATPALAQQPGQSILLRNVVLIGQGADKKPVRINILVKDKLLDIMTEDPISFDNADETYDAAGGVVLGKLKLGQPATFLILDEDPRTNVDVLLDTKTHATFAIRRGEVLKNTYVMVFSETPAEKARSDQGWLAYASPPLAIPLDYGDDSKWNKAEGKYVSGLLAGAVVLDRQQWVGQDDDSEFQVGDLADFDGGEIRALRVGGVGTINFDRPWVWVAFGATHAFDKGFDSEESDDFTMFDLRLDIPLWDKASFSVGKQKEPISMERIMSMIELPQQERAAVSDALLPSRNVGIVMAGTLFNDRATLAGGAFNNWLDKDQPNSFSENSTQFVGRGTWLPYISDNESSLLHLGIGLRHSDTEEGTLGKTSPEFNSAPDYVETPFMQTENSMSYQAEASVRSGPFWLHGEYIHTDIDAPVYGDPSYDGYHVTASWILTGEVRPYNRRVGIFDGIPVARDVNQNGWGAWEISTRFSHVDLSDGLQLDGSAADGGEMDIWSAGLNWWLTPLMQFGANYRYITLDRYGVEGASQGINARLLMLLE